ncbi:unnamed protein product, partial [Ixodes pacificus]
RRPSGRNVAFLFFFVTNYFQPPSTNVFSSKSGTISCPLFCCLVSKTLAAALRLFMSLLRSVCIYRDGNVGDKRLDDTLCLFLFCLLRRFHSKLPFVDENLEKIQTLRENYTFGDSLRFLLEERDTSVPT